MIKSFDLDKVYQFSLIAIAFLMPLTVFGANFFIVLVSIFWLCSGNYREKLALIGDSRLMLASILFFLLHLVGLVWTDDMKWGFHILHKMWYFLLLFPIFYTIVRQDFIKYYVGAFLIAITISEIVSYLIWFELIPPFKYATISNPTPFMSHISYNPILAFSIYLLCYQVFLNGILSKLNYLAYLFFAITMSVNMFITGGRAGQVMFFVLIAILSFQIFSKKKFLALIIASILIPFIFYLAYSFSELFHYRVNEAISNVVNYSEKKNTSIGQRITYAINSWEIIINNVFFGVGTGDYPLEYNKVNDINSPQVLYSTNPHNMYILVFVQLGLLGIFSMLSIFFYQIKFALLSKDNFSRNVGLALPLFFIVIMFSDSYLLGHYTTLMFVFFSSFLHNNFARNK